MKYANATNTTNDRQLFAFDCNKSKQKSNHFRHCKQKAYKQKRSKCNDGNVGLYQLLNTMINVK